MNGIHMIHKERLPLHYQQEVCSFYLNFVNKQTQQVENIASLSFQIIADLVTMPPKSDYWKYFVVQGVLAVCQLPGCPKPNVSLGAPPKPGQKKRISEYKLFHSCSKLKNFFQLLAPSPTIWQSITSLSGMHTVRRGQGRRQWRPRSRRR